MSRQGMGLLALVAGASTAFSAPASAQRHHVTMAVAYSAPAPEGLRGWMTSRTPVGSARHGGPFFSAGVERGGEVSLRMEAVYSRHSSSGSNYLGTHRGESVSAAEKEVTAGLMASVLVPFARLSGGAVRATASGGILRTGLRGRGTVGGDVAVPAVDSNTAPAVGVGLELPVPFAGHDVLVAVRGAQLVSHQRGGGYVAAGVGLRW